jgi:polyphosphate kinase
VRGSQDRTRAEEYHGREAVKATTRAAQEEFTGELEAKAELADADLRDPELYINRELSMLDFFDRVLDEARDEHNPLIERVKFVGIVGSILGEFFMVRIAGLRQQVEAGVTRAAADGYTPQQLLPIVQERARGVMKAARQCFSELKPELEAAGIHIIDYADLDAGQKAALERYYQDKVFPVLTPLAFDPGRPFPHISNMSHNLGGSSRSSPPTSRACSRAWTCSSRTRSASPATPSWPSRSWRRTTSSRPSSSSSAGAASARWSA